jgi:thiamine pyrophosphate-dependent acetolactate synthase large subunit-like protein
MKTKAYLLAFALLFATVAVCVAAEDVKIRSSDEEIAKTAGILNESRKVTIFGGHGCAGAHTELNRACGEVESTYRTRAPRQGIHRV